MDNYIVSARKYRPQTFDTVVGQASITSTLKNAIRNNQLAQAFLFCGPRGVGKTTCARILAKTINCERITPETEPCDECPSCRAFNENASFSILELDGASNNSVDEIRTLVESVRVPPISGKFKVYIIDEVHMLSASAFNAFLKTLEEPPPYAKFILATTEKHKIIPTILSRCQIFDFKRITVEDIVGHLKYVAQNEHVEADEEALHIIGQKADGAMRDALSMFDQLVSFSGNTLTYELTLENLNVLDYDYFFRIMGFILSGDHTNTLLTINEIIDKGFEGQHFLIGFGEHLRNLLVCQDKSTLGLLETSQGIRNRYLEQAGQCRIDLLLKLLDINNRCDLNYKISSNKRLHVELALMQMCGLQYQQTTQIDIPPRMPVPPAKPAEPPEHKQAPPAKPVQKASAPDSKPMGTLKKPIPDMISIRADVPVKEKNGKPKIEEETRVEEITGFSQEELQSAWNRYTETLTESPHLYNAFSRNKPVLGENYSIDLDVDNKVQEDEIHYQKPELLGFLKKELKNGTITLNTHVRENVQVFKPYTSKEKFDRMVGKNPSVIDLKDQLNLDIEY